MQLKPNALSLLVLAAALLSVRASPVLMAAGDTSGEDEEDSVASSRLSDAPTWDLLLGAIKPQKEFEVEFQGMKNESLEQYKIPSLPRSCPSSNFSKEACLQRLVHGLSIYSFLLRHVEKEYPENSILPRAEYYIGALINLMKSKMKSPESVVTVTSVQEHQLQKELDHPSEFHRKVTSYSLVRELRSFLVDAKRALAKRERLRLRPERRTTPSS